jgi:hypothetical protein
MWVTGPPLFRPVHWFGVLVVWFLGLTRRARARLRRRRESLTMFRERTCNAAPCHLSGRDAALSKRARRRPTALAVAAVVSSETAACNPRTPRTMAVGDRNSPTELEQALSLLHDLRGLLVLDLTAARSAPLEHCRVIATSWPSGTAPPTPHTRLAILVRFEHWALLQPLVTEEFALLATKGVEALLCCEEQRWDEWFLAGAVVHDIERVVRTLSALAEHQESQGTDSLTPSHWRIVLTTAASLLDGPHPETLCELARVALACRANEQALEFANEAVRVANKGSVLECRALRLVGAAMMRQGLGSGAQALEDALDLAVSMGATHEAAAALNDLGLHELKCGARHAAESRLRAAMALCPSEHAELWTALRDCLAQNPPN